MKEKIAVTALVLSMLLTACGHTGREETVSERSGNSILAAESGGYFAGNKAAEEKNIIMLDFGGQTGTYKVTVRPFSMDAVWIPFEIIKKEAGRLAENLRRAGACIRTRRRSGSVHCIAVQPVARTVILDRPFDKS